MSLKDILPDWNRKEAMCVFVSINTTVACVSPTLIICSRIDEECLEWQIIDLNDRH